MAEPAVIVEKDGPVLTVTLNRPEKRNAVNGARTNRNAVQTAVKSAKGIDHLSDLR